MEFVREEAVGGLKGPFGAPKYLPIPIPSTFPPRKQVASFLSAYHNSTYVPFVIFTLLTKQR